MRLAGVPFWNETDDVGQQGSDAVSIVPAEPPSTSSVTTPLLPTTTTSRKNNVIKNSPRLGKSEVNGNYEEIKSAGLLPPLRSNTSNGYGAIGIPIGVNSEMDEEDSDSEDEAKGGFPSEAGWSARMRRPSRAKRDSCGFQYLGIILILAYALFSSLSGLTVKLLEKDFHPYAICFWRFSAIFCISAVVMTYTKLFTNIKLWPGRLVEEKHEHLKNGLLLLVSQNLNSSFSYKLIFWPVF